MKYYSVLFLGFIGFLPASCILEKEGSVFTSVNTDQCQLVQQKKEGDDDTESSVVKVDKTKDGENTVDLVALEEGVEEIAKAGETAFECKGVKGYKLYMVDDGTRSWYVLTHPKKGIISLEQDIVYKQNILGDFPHVGGDEKVEWLLNKKGVPSGLVFSVFSRLNDKKTGQFKTIARYFAVKLDTAKPVMAGVAKTQQAVKELLKESY